VREGFRLRRALRANSQREVIGDSTGFDEQMLGVVKAGDYFDGI
jgi:hypothetical protein